MSEDFASILSTVTYSFTAVFISEIGDKTFMLLVSLSKSNSSFFLVLLNQLAMTPIIILSALVGDYLSFLPYFYVSLLGTLCFLIYSIVCLRASYHEYKKSKVNDHEKKYETKYKPLFDEQKWWKFSLAVIATIVCMEITDSSEFALFSLALTYDATCVIIGAFLAHAACAVLAVSIGKLVSKYVSECITQLCVGCFFLWLTCLWTYYCVQEGIVYFG